MPTTGSRPIPAASSFETGGGQRRRPGRHRRPSPAGQPPRGGDAGWGSGSRGHGALGDERGSVSPTSVETDAAGAAATSWTTQDLFAQQFASAQVDGGGTIIGFLARTTPDPAATNTILVLSEGGNRFDPAQYTIPEGGTVNWFWPEGSTGHNIVPDDGDSPPQSGPPADYPKFHVFRFTKPGVFRYHCSIHGGPGGVGMSGVITVAPPVNE